MDLTAAQTELQARGASHVSTSRLTTWLNDAKNEFEDFFPWPWLEATTTGTAPVTISDLKAVLYVVDTTQQAELTGLPAQFIVEDLDETITTTGSPDVWWLDGTTTLKVYPANTTNSLSVRYVKFSPELSGSSDTPLIPVRNHNLWIDLAYIRVLKDSDEVSEAQALQMDCNAKLQKLVETYAARNRQNGSTFVQLRGGSVDW